MNHNAHSPETRHRREKRFATNSFTANTAVPMILRALCSSSFSHERRTKYKTTKNVKGQIPSFIFSHSSRYVTSNPCSYFAPVPVFRTSSVFSLTRSRCILPIASLPSSTFPCNIIPITSFFIIDPIEWNSAYRDCIFRKGRGPGATYLGHIHLPDLFCVWLIVSLARSAGHNVQILNWRAKAIIWGEAVKLGDFNAGQNSTRPEDKYSAKSSRDTQTHSPLTTSEPTAWNWHRWWLSMLMVAKLCRWMNGCRRFEG